MGAAYKCRDTRADLRRGSLHRRIFGHLEPSAAFVAHALQLCGRRDPRARRIRAVGTMVHADDVAQRSQSGRALHAGHARDWLRQPTKLLAQEKGWHVRRGRVLCAVRHEQIHARRRRPDANRHDLLGRVDLESVRSRRHAIDACVDHLAADTDAAPLVQPASVSGPLASDLVFGLTLSKIEPTRKTKPGIDACSKISSAVYARSRLGSRAMRVWS